MSLQNSQQISNVKILLKKGQDGNGIVSIEKTGTQDNVDTYTITYADGGKDTFTVTNGKSINSIVKTGTSGLVDTYTITYNDTSTATFTVTNGRGIQSITKTGTVAGVDTYTITYNDNTTSTFTVTNGTVATGVSYNNSTSGLTADDVQEAIDELAGGIPSSGTIELMSTADAQIFTKTVNVPAGKKLVACAEQYTNVNGAFVINTYDAGYTWYIQAKGFGNFTSSTTIKVNYVIV